MDWIPSIWKRVRGDLAGTFFPVLGWTFDLGSGSYCYYFLFWSFACTLIESKDQAQELMENNLCNCLCCTTIRFSINDGSIP